MLIKRKYISIIAFIMAMLIFASAVTPVATAESPSLQEGTAFTGDDEECGKP